MKNWKIGLVGTGWWSEKHLKAWARIPGVETAALCNRSREKLVKKAEEFGVPQEHLYPTLDEMLQYSDIDAVDIVTGPETHLEFVGKAAAAGKHVLCQKPFAPTLEEAGKMVDICEKAGVLLMVTENWRWLQRSQMIKKAIDSGALGKIHAARYIHTDYYTPRFAPGVELPQPFFREMPKLLFYEMGVHWYDTWRYLFGTPKRLYAELATVSPYIKGEDSGIVVLGYDDFYGFMDMSWATRQKLDNPPGERVYPDHLEQFVIDGSEGTLKLYTSGKITIVAKDGLSENIFTENAELDHEESHFRLQSHFVDCLNTGKEFQTSGRHNLTTLEMSFGTYESAKTHMPYFIGKEQPEVKV